MKNLERNFTGMDEDVELQAAYYTSTRNSTFKNTKIRKTGTIRQNHPHSFTSHCEIPFLEQAGVTHAFMGITKSIEKLQEAWRISNKVEFHEQEARIAKLIMDVLAMMAISVTIKFPSSTEYGHTAKRAVITKTSFPST